MAIIIYCGVYTGALVRHADASLAYGGWPLPFHDLVPHSEQDWVQLTHRIMAFIVFTIIMITYIHAVKNYPNNRTVHYGYTAAFILVILQVITGALSIMTNVNLIIALFHALFITYLFGMTTYFIMLMLRSVRSDKQQKANRNFNGTPIKITVLYQYLKLNLRHVKTRLHVNCCVISFYFNHFSQLLFNFD